MNAKNGASNICKLRYINVLMVPVVGVEYKLRALNIADDPFVQRELITPVLPVVRVEDVEQAIELTKEEEHCFRHTSVMYSKNVDSLTKYAKKIQTIIQVKNGPFFAELGVGRPGYTTLTIACPTGEGLTSAKDFARSRRYAPS